MSRARSWEDYQDLLRAHLLKFGSKDSRRPDFNETIAGLSWIKGIFPTATLSQCHRIAIALERCKPGTQLVRVPWKPLTDAVEINKLHAKFVRDGRDPDDASWAAILDGEVSKIKDTYATALPDGWGNDEDSCFLHGNDPYVLPAIR